jgi:hypothetical protein
MWQFFDNITLEMELNQCLKRIIIYCVTLILSSFDTVKKLGTLKLGALCNVYFPMS